MHIRLAGNRAGWSPSRIRIETVNQFRVITKFYSNQ